MPEHDNDNGIVHTQSDLLCPQLSDSFEIPAITFDASCVPPSNGEIVISCEDDLLFGITAVVVNGVRFIPEPVKMPSFHLEPAETPDA